MSWLNIFFLRIINKVLALKLKGYEIKFVLDLSLSFCDSHFAY
jgi:hypothetical protein